MKHIQIFPGLVLVSRDEKKNPGAWLVFYYDEGAGAAAVDLTTEHPHIPYKGFEAALRAEDIKPDSEKLVLLGGPERSDDALLILHDAASATEKSILMNEDFGRLAYTYKLIPGKPSVLMGPDDKPTEIKLKKRAHFLVIMGYRTWEGDALEREIENGEWIVLPAAKKTVFETGRRERRKKILNAVN